MCLCRCMTVRSGPIPKICQHLSTYTQVSSYEQQHHFQTRLSKALKEKKTCRAEAEAITALWQRAFFDLRTVCSNEPCQCL